MRPARKRLASAAARTAPEPRGLAGPVIDWQRSHGRHGLPWQAVDPRRAPLRDPYRVWLSEVMLQQTQVSTVIPYFEAFLAAFPTVGALAGAPAERVMSRWSGLGYYSRARNLLAAAGVVQDRFGGQFPDSAAALAELPGVGRSTAAAIAVFSFGERAAILDGNVKRVFSRVFAVDGLPTQSTTLEQLWAHAEAELPAAPARAADLIDYTQGLMDLGATRCLRTRPLCSQCPLAELCTAYQTQTIDRYPAARPRRLVPLRTADLLLVRCGDEVLLETRPQKGIWGGLRSLPELRAPTLAETLAGSAEAGPTAGADAHGAMRALATAWLAGQGLTALSPPYPLGRLQHVFTHFRLDATIWSVEVGAVARRSAVAGLPPVAGPLAWLALTEAGDAPLPGPIRRLLLAEPDLLVS